MNDGILDRGILPAFSRTAIAALRSCRSAARWPLGIAAVLAAGCGNPDPVLHPAGGTVKFAGAAATGFTVEFSSQAAATRGITASGTVGPDGRFSLRTRIRGTPRDGAVAGPHRVVVVPPSPATHPGPVAAVPMRYADYVSSGLKAEVVAEGTTPITLELSE